MSAIADRDEAGSLAEPAADLASSSGGPVQLVYDLSEMQRFEVIAREIFTAAHSDTPRMPERFAMIACLFARSKYESDEAKKEKSLHCMLRQELFVPRGGGRGSDLESVLHRFSRPRPSTYKNSSESAPRPVPTSTLVA
jgi:hypothetical protein